MMALVSCSLPAATCRVGCVRSLAVASAMRTRAVAVCKASDKDGAQQKLLASLNAGLNSWSNFEEEAPGQAPRTKNAAKQKTKRKGKEGKLYLRDGPKRPAAATKLSKRRMSTVADAATAAAAERGRPASTASAKVRIEESRSGGKGKKTTVIRGLPAEAARDVLRELKTALAVGGRVNDNGDLEIQGAHAELVLLRLQRSGYGDVRLAGGAGAKKPGAPAWNAPKEIREQAAARKQAARDAKEAAARKERAAARSPAAVADRMLAQLKASEQLEIAKLRRSDVPAAEKQQAREKLDRIQQRLAEM